MKVDLSLLIILLMAGACWSGRTCRMADWWFSFDSEGWSECNSDEYVTGFYRSHRRTHSDPIYRLEEARCCKASCPYQDASSTCEHRNWWSALDGPDRWATCSTGYFIQKIYRSHGHGVSNIEMAKCCKPSQLPKRYKYCYDEDVRWSFDKKGLSKCDDGYFLVGINRQGCNRLHCIDWFRCCSMDV